MSIMDGYSADLVWSELARMDPNSPAMMEEVDSIEASFSELFGGAAKTRSSKETQQPGNLVIRGQSPVRRRSGGAADLGMRRYRSFLLIDHNQQLMVSSAEQFIEHLNVDRDAKVKVVSIFGNTGDGKSHTLNHTFFGGRPIFKTSSEQGACTLGVWAAYDDELKIICLDTEGLQGMSLHENKTTRLLLKVLAISDVVIYRTVSEKLQREMYDFLGAASKAYVHHFQNARTKGDESEETKCNTREFGPSVIIFHETRHIDPLQDTPDNFAETMISHHFRNKKQNIEAFSSIEYVGIQTHHRYTDFTSLRTEVQKQLDNTELRLARNPAVVYDTLKIINDAFSGELEIVNNARFPNQYFICNAECKSCNQRCELQGGHLMDGRDHYNHNNCRFQLQFDNKVKICKKCYLNGHTAYVKISQVTQEDGWFNLSKLAYPGLKVDCPNCGEIFKSWPSLIPNTDPEIGTIRIDIIHVWSLPENYCETSHTGQRLVDTVLNLSSTIESYTSVPVIRNWLFNQCNPSYWRPDSELIRCHKCKTLFSSLVTKHHCRACGEGFCDACSSNTRPVPVRNWPDPVRVCDDCYELNDEDIGAAAEAPPVADVGPRWFTEHVFYGLGAVGSLINYSKSLIKDTARPSYWVPDSELTNCCVCEKEFSPQLPYHHCRDCGRGVCDNCSKTRKPVPRRNWPDPVRVCDACIPN